MNSVSGSGSVFRHGVGIAVIAMTMAMAGCGGGGDSGSAPIVSSSSSSGASSSSSSVASSSSSSVASSSSNVSSGSSSSAVSYTLSGSVSGLVSTGLVLSNNSVQLPVVANATTFTFGSVLSTGGTYAVSVASSPTGYTCSVANGSGTTGTANVANVVVTCSTQSYTLGGTVSGLTTAGLVLANGTTTVTVPANANSFTFPGTVAFGSSYNVTVQTQAAGQNCAVTSASGSMPAANVINVTVNCSAKPFNVGGSIAGLGAATGLVLANNGGDLLTVAANATTFTMPTKVAFGGAYAISVSSQPVGRTCSVASGSGTMGAADVTNVAVTCSLNSYSVSGTVSGATVAGLTLLLNGGNSQTVAVNGTSFAFTTQIASGGTYAVTAGTQPTGKTCTVSNGTGTVVGSNITNVTVTCATSTYTLGGSITGLTSSGLVLANSTDTVSPAANATQYTFPNGVAYQATYNVTIQTQPTALSCSVSNASGTMGLANVTNVGIGCNAVAVGTNWAWMGGSQNTFTGGTYGTLGTGSVNNIAGARENAVTWKDGSGNFWMAQGYGIAESSFGHLSDVWKYNPTNGQWTWVSGAKTPEVAPDWGTKGVAASSNTPGGRQDAQFWQDSAGNLWTFAGLTLAAAGPAPGAVAEAVICQDVWKYDITTRQWTWMHGPSTCTAGASGNNIAPYPWETTTGNGSVYGTLGVASATNIPSNRRGAATWVDAAGNFWMFGGLGYNATNGGAEWCADLWRYNSSTNQWTWMGGSQTPNFAGVYGTKGTAAAGNIPPARLRAVAWADTAGNLWLFGGQIPGNGQYSNDLWKYNIASGQWTWVSGSSTANAAGSYGNIQTPDAANVPGARLGGAGWIDTAGTLWMYGGNNGTGLFSDLWNYQPSTGLWTWYRGVNTQNFQGIHGTLGTPGSNNYPGARKLFQRWIDSGNRLWLFGGQGYDGTTGYGNLNDLWKY